MDDFAGLVEELATDDEAYIAAIEQVGAAQAGINQLNMVAGTKNVKPTLRKALDRAAQIRYERSDEMKRQVTVGGHRIGDYSVVLTSPQDERTETRLAIDDMEAFCAYVMRDAGRMVDLIEDSAERLLDGYMSEGEVPDGCRVETVTVPAVPQVFRYMRMNVDSRLLPALSDAGDRLLSEAIGDGDGAA